MQSDQKWLKSGQDYLKIRKSRDKLYRNNLLSTLGLMYTFSTIVHFCDSVIYVIKKNVPTDVEISKNGLKSAQNCENLHQNAF